MMMMHRGGGGDGDRHDEQVASYVAAQAAAIHNVLSDLWITVRAYTQSSDTLAVDNMRKGLAEVAGWSAETARQHLAPTVRRVSLVRDVDDVALHNLNKLTFLFYARQTSEKLQRTQRQTVVNFRTLSWGDLGEMCLKALVSDPHISLGTFFTDRSPDDQIRFLEAKVVECIKRRITNTYQLQAYVPARRHHRLPPPPPRQRRREEAGDEDGTLLAQLQAGGCRGDSGGGRRSGGSGMDLLPTLNTHVTAADSASQVAVRLLARKARHTRRGRSDDGDDDDDNNDNDNGDAADEDHGELAHIASVSAPAPAPAPASAPAPAPAPASASASVLQPAAASLGFDFDADGNLSRVGSAVGSVRVAASSDTLDAGTVLSTHPIFRV